MLDDTSPKDGPKQKAALFTDLAEIGVHIHSYTDSQRPPSAGAWKKVTWIWSFARKTYRSARSREGLDGGFEPRSGRGYGIHLHPDR